MFQPHEEMSLILIKKDGIQKGLIGECIKRFEDRGLALRGLKLVSPTQEQVRGHYCGGEAWVRQLGQRTLDDLARYELDPLKEVGSTDPISIGNLIVDWLVSYLSPGPAVAMVVSGVNAVEMARKIAGATVPQKADLGSIRGDYSTDSPILAMLEKRPISNIVHASGSVEEAVYEVKHWFTSEELYPHSS